MKTLLLVSNRRPDEAGGRAEKVGTRIELFEENGWRIEIGYVSQPYVATFPLSIFRCLWTAIRTEADVVVSINNPFHLHLIGFLVSRVVGKPWLSELRDPISNHPDRDPGTLMTQLATWVESLVVHESDRVVWLDGIQLNDEYLLQEYPQINPSRFVKLPFMGYDREQFSEVVPAEYDDFTVTYAGSFYKGWIEPDTLLRGVAEYIERTGDRDFRLQFYGDWNDDYDQLVRELHLDDIVSAHGFVPHSEIVPILKGSDAVLYIGGTDPRNRLNVPSKIWDYIGARTPILGVVDPEFRVADFIQEYRLGIVTDETVGGIADAFETLRSEYEFDPDERAFEFTRDRLIAAYVEVLDEVVR